MPKVKEATEEEEYYVPQLLSDSDTSDVETPLEKPKNKRSVRSEAQKQAFEKARQKRLENLREKKRQKQEEEKGLQQAVHKKPKSKKVRVVQEEAPVDQESSESEEEVVVVKKSKRANKVKTQRLAKPAKKPKKKKRYVYESESSESETESDASTDYDSDDPWSLPSSACSAPRPKSKKKKRRKALSSDPGCGDGVPRHNSLLYTYETPAGDVQGPFNCHQMRQWHLAGYFPPGTPVLARAKNEEGCADGRGIGAGAESFDWGGGDERRLQMHERTERRLRDMREARRVELEQEPTPEPEPEPEQEPQPQPQPQPLAGVAGAYKSGDALFHDSLTPCTVLSVHVDPSGGPEYYTVRMSDSGGERQTLASRLSRARRDFGDGDVCTTERHDAPVVVLGYEEGLYVVGVFDGERQSVERIEVRGASGQPTAERRPGGLFFFFFFFRSRRHLFGPS